MIKIDKRAVQIEGKASQVLLELAILIREIRDMLDDEAIDVAVEVSKEKKVLDLLMLMVFDGSEMSALETLLAKLELAKALGEEEEEDE